MKKQLIEIVANLSATIVSGRYNISAKAYDIIKETPKTYTIVKGGYTERIMKNSLHESYSDFSNNSIHRLQLRILCTNETEKESLDKLEASMHGKIIELKKLSDNAIEAFEARFENN